jgi:SAM-dependent methyltransferase
VLCGAALQLHAERKQGAGKVFDVLSGRLDCAECGARYPILAGVAVLVQDVRGFLLEHIKGIAAVVPDAELPREYARELKAAKAELRSSQGHIEDDLEAERVISLYLMNHYLHAGDGKPWWRPEHGQGSPLIDSLVREHWDLGPLAQIARIVQGMARPPAAPLRAVELGCGVGGLALKLGAAASAYLGVDSSFAAIALARHLVLGAPYPGKIRIPGDLLWGPVSRVLELGPPSKPVRDGSRDFVVGELEATPVARGQWDLAVALNTIDMLEEPGRLPELKKELLKKGGVAIQSCPYIWHEAVAKRLRARLPKDARDSAAAVEWLYSRAGFAVETRQDHVPWLFFKHSRQLEIYSVHLFQARLA